MNLSEMMTFVRTHADTDETDAPTASLTLYARLAYNDIRRRVSQWVPQESEETLTSTDGIDTLTPTIEYVSQIIGPTELLHWIPWTEYLELVDGDSIIQNATEATHYSVRNGLIYLWPTPNAATDYTVYGRSAFATWPSGSDEPDLPREFDEAICWFMLAKYYMAQEDIELAQLYNAEYEMLVGRFIAFQLRQDTHTPRILHGAMRGRMTYEAWMRRNTQG